jgi:hypothetical protein
VRADFPKREVSGAKLLDRLFERRNLVWIYNHSTVPGDGHKISVVRGLQLLSESLIEFIVLGSSFFQLLTVHSGSPATIGAIQTQPLEEYY